jgi:hypothetical protein
MKIDDFQKIPPYTRSGSYAVDIPLDHLERSLTRYAVEYHLDMDPEFQRGYVWTPEQQIRFVEHVLRDGAVTGKDVYFNCPSWMKLGKQKAGMVLGGWQAAAFGAAPVPAELHPRVRNLLP